MKPHSILLHPTPEAIASSIFKPDAFGGKPPTMFWDGQKWTGSGCTVAGVGAHRMAIVLAGGGDALPFGVAACDTNHPMMLLRALMDTVDPHQPDDLDRVRALVRHLGTIVLLDEHGKVIE